MVRYGLRSGQRDFDWLGSVLRERQRVRRGRLSAA